MSPPQAPPLLALSVEDLFRAEGAYVLRALRYFGIPEADVRDACQEVFVVVHRKLAEFERRSSIRTWLYRICQRTAADYRRRAHVRCEVLAKEPIDSNRGEERDVGAGIDARALLLRALSALDPDQRDVVVLFEIEGLPMKEVAEVLGCPLQTAYSRLHAARRVMCEVVGEEQRGVA